MLHDPIIQTCKSMTVCKFVNHMARGRQTEMAIARSLRNRQPPEKPHGEILASTCSLLHRTGVQCGYSILELVQCKWRDMMYYVILSACSRCSAIQFAT